ARLFRGAHYAFKFHLAAVSLRPGADVAAVAHRLDAIGEGITFFPPAPMPEVQTIRDVAALPLALSAFLALLAVGAVGHALSIAVRRRRPELAGARGPGGAPPPARVGGGPPAGGPCRVRAPLRG